MARRKKKVEEQMDIFEEGGLKDEGGTVDPISGNDVPPGSTQSEVRDDIPAQLSEGEFVFPADVVRYIGLENLMELRQKAKTGLQKMEDMGQMGNSEEATMSDDVAFEDTIDKTIEALPMAMGGAVPSPMKKQRTPFKRPVQNFKIGGTPQVGNPLTSTQTTPVATQPITLPKFSSFVQQPAMQQVQGLQPVVESKEFIGPNGERVTIQFVNGQPATPVPDGYREMTAQEKEEAMKPKIEKPKISQEDNSDDRAREEERNAQMKTDKEISNTLASYDKEFAKQWDQDPFNTGNIGVAGPMGAIFEGVQTHLSRTSAIERIAEKENIDLEDYKNTGLSGMFSKYDDERFARDLQAKREDEDEVDFPTTPTGKQPAGRVSFDVDEDAPVRTPRGKDITDEVREELARQKDTDDADSEDSGTGGTSEGSFDASTTEDSGYSSSFAKGGAVKQKRKRGLGRLK